MKKITMFLVLGLIAAFAFVGSAHAQNAYSAAFTTSITYQNVGSGTATVVFSFYPENNGTAITYNASLAPNAGGSLFVGSINALTPGFNGSAVVSSDQPIVATMVQISSDTAIKNRPLSNGFSNGASEFLLATVLKNQFNSTTRFSVQNAHSTNVDLTLEFYNASNPAAAPIVVTHNGLPPGAAKYFDMGSITQITAASFNGSAIISAVESGTSNPANIVASALELSTNSVAASSFEGVSSGSTTVYMPSAICNAFGGQNTAYAIQNTGATTATGTVTFSNGNTVPLSIAAGAKQSVQGCSGGNTAGFSGSATIVSNQPVVVIGKVFGAGLSTAFVGATAGSETLALPYVRWSESQYAAGTRQRAFVAIQNVGGALSAGNVVVKFVNRDGNVVGTHSLGAMATGQKLNTNASLASVASGFTQNDLDEFGYIGGFGGGIIIEAPPGSQLVAVVRVSSTNGSSLVGEDYNGIAVGP